MTKTNEALAKAAEELSQGLAKDEPLIVTEATRSHTGLVKRASADVALRMELAKLSGDHEAAPDRIIAGYRLRATRETEMKTPRYDEYMPAGRFEDKLIADIDLIDQYDKWCVFCPHRMRDTAIDIFVHGQSFTSMSISKRRDRATLRRWALQAVQAWVDTIPRKDRPLRPSMPKREAIEFVPTRVVIFEE